MDRSTTTRALQKLVMNDFIEKKEDPHNKKIKRLFPTEKGKMVYPFIKRENEHSDFVVLDGFAEKEAVNCVRSFAANPEKC